MSRTISRSWPLLTSITLHGVLAGVLSGVVISIPQQSPPSRPEAPVPIIRWEPPPPSRTAQPVSQPLPEEPLEVPRETAVESTPADPISEPRPHPQPPAIEAQSPIVATAEEPPHEVEPQETRESEPSPVEPSPLVVIEVFEPATVALEWQPIYPRECIRKGQQGEVLLLVQLSAEGDVLSVKVQQSSGHRLLDRAAVRSVERLRFIPATRDGVPVSSTLELPLLYQLDS